MISMAVFSMCIITWAVVFLKQYIKKLWKWSLN